jgi:aryl-alcohol dehydrogenase-like predicted oxidoreductase
LVGLGANNFGTSFWGNRCDQNETTRVIHAALDVGINFIDTAEEYSTRSKSGIGTSEQYIGMALRTRRDEVVIASKFGIANPDDAARLRARTVISAAEESLRRLGTDRIDLYQQHYPDPRLPVDQVLAALDRLVCDGKVREIGCSNFSSEMITAAATAGIAGGTRCFASAQNEYNILTPPDGVRTACTRHGLMLLPYRPLASGLLTGKYGEDGTAPLGSRLAGGSPVSESQRQSLLVEHHFTKIAKLSAFAKQHGHSLLDLAFSWLASQPVVASVIAGATSPEQVRQNAAAISWELTPDDFEAIAAIVA